MTFTVTPTTPEDFEALPGEPFEFRVKAITAKVGDKVIGIAGLGFHKNGSVIGWARLTDEIRKRPIQLHKAAKAFLADARVKGIHTIIATADPEQPAAERWLERLGFKPDTFLGEKVYIWKCSRT